MSEPIFVFGSNLAGRHGKGAAAFAKRKHGAQPGVGVGRTGNAYAIPTKGHALRVLPLDLIRSHVNAFIVYAREHPELQFQLTPIGCGLAGYRPEQIAPFFAKAPLNVNLPAEFLTVLSRGHKGGA